MTDERPATGPRRPTPAGSPDVPLDLPADPARLGPTVVDGAPGLAAQVDAERRRRDDLWSRGFTRRRFLAGAAWPASRAWGRSSRPPGRPTAWPPARARWSSCSCGAAWTACRSWSPPTIPTCPPPGPGIGVPAGALLPLTRGFGLHPALAPLHNLWKVGAFTAVPAVSTPDISRSHFQAQDCLGARRIGHRHQRGLARPGARHAGPGTTFRAMGTNATVPRALAGDQRALAVDGLERFRLGGWEEVHRRRSRRLGPCTRASITRSRRTPRPPLEALDIARLVVPADHQPAAPYPEGEFAARLADVARLIKADVGLRVASVDVGGWDMHTNLGTVESGAMTRQLTLLGETLARLRHRPRRPPGRRDGGGHDRVRPPCRGERQRRAPTTGTAQRCC